MQIQEQSQRRPPKKAGGRYKFKDYVNDKRAGGTPPLRIQRRRQSHPFRRAGWPLQVQLFAFVPTFITRHFV
jgi:hypothetical protein